MRTLNNINSSFDSSSRTSTTGLAARRSAKPVPIATSASANKLPIVASSKPLPRTPTSTTNKLPPAQARPGRFHSSASSTTSVARSSTGTAISSHGSKQHVLALTATKISTRSTPSSSVTPKMPPGGDSRPRPPQLSAAAAKNVGRTPLTPKIASSAKGPSIAAPLARRSTQGLPSGLPYRDDTASPSVYLTSSVTPRSGSRSSRAVESNHTTPNGTPNPDRDGWDPRASLTSSSGRPSLTRSDSPADPDSKFFRASDAQGPSQPTSRPSTASHRHSSTSTFFYANGNNPESKRTMSPPVTSPFTPILSSTPEPTPTKFFYANGAPDLKPSGQSSGPSSTNSSTSRLQSGRPSTGNSASGHSNHTYSMPPRPHSPIKTAQPSPSILKNTGTPGLNSRTQLAAATNTTSPTGLAPAATVNSKRRVSIESAPRKLRGHARTGSVPNFDPSHSPRMPMSPPRLHSEPASPPRSPGSSQPALTMASILQVAEELADEEEAQDDEESQPEVQSPTKSNNSSDPVNELVANARRERKVQDLEITNASLEAINRTLERQLRKQNAEIRRYKRLSRAGHLSAAPSEAPSRVPSEVLAEPPVSLTLADLSEEDSAAPSEDEEEHDSLDDSDLSMTDSVSASDALDPNDEKTLEKAAARRRRDERRLQLDLSKHRELLVDSQKINQSIKRCLNWTEILIKEGQKALDYKVRICDVEFGGHVLPPLGDDEDEDLDDDILTQDDDLDQDTEDTGLEPPLPWEKSSQDRDSGIELQAEGN
ncbi:hypothetical protein CEP53_011274 [Fusarium sp. AF-6]|nr:hypothetical protein CEP53_011274 [Fusarium sp. AF-6]